MAIGLRDRVQGLTRPPGLLLLRTHRLMALLEFHAGWIADIAPPRSIRKLGVVALIDSIALNHWNDPVHS